jgi:YidC/Oxa1 family membrane protein insertase
MEERRLLIAVALSLLVLTAYQLLFAPPPRPPGASPSAAASPGTSPSAPPSASPAPSSAPGVATSAAPAASPTPASEVPAVADQEERRVEVTTPDVAVAFNNKGARIISWKLSRFGDASGRPEELVQTVKDAPHPFDLETSDTEVDTRLRQALFLPSATQLTAERGKPAEIRFRYAAGDLEAEKVMRFPGEGYLVEVTARVRKAGRDLPTRVLWGPGVGNPTAEEKKVNGYHPPQAVFLTPAGVERVPVEKIGSTRAIPLAQWAGVESTYFAALWVPPAGGSAEIRALALPGDPPSFGPQAVVTLPAADVPALLYVGPKDHNALSSIGHGLVQVVPVGEWIGPIVIPFMKLLRWVHGNVGNYGWSIVVLTILISLVMAPLRHYGIANGLKMAKLSPEMKAIQDRYRGLSLVDPRRQDMQQEIMDLYERHGMSMGTQMAVGCLPILLTMPFLIAFYRVLQVSIELRGASFLWIPDLSQTDPIYLTPLLMGASTFLMTKFQMAPTAMDPTQQRVMMIMPVVLSAMFLWAPAGLNLYWLASNVCSLIQQTVTMRVLKAQDERPAPKKERRR